MTEPGADTATSLLAIDHVALRVLDPDAMAAFLSEHCAMQRLGSVEGMTVLHAAGGRTALVLLEADRAAEPGVLQRVVMRVSDLERALSLLRLKARRVEPELAVFDGPEGLELGLTAVLGGGVDYDVDHLVLRVLDPGETTIALAELGFVPEGGALHVADKHLRLQTGIRSAGENELLSHIGVAVDSVAPVRRQALRGGLEFDEFTLAPNKLGVYVRGPERIRVEYTDEPLTSSRLSA